MSLALKEPRVVLINAYHIPMIKTAQTTAMMAGEGMGSFEVSGISSGHLVKANMRRARKFGKINANIPSAALSSLFSLDPICGIFLRHTYRSQRDLLLSHRLTKSNLMGLLILRFRSPVCF
jgi:hypothetical protein